MEVRGRRPGWAAAFAYGTGRFRRVFDRSAGSSADAVTPRGAGGLGTGTLRIVESKSAP